MYAMQRKCIILYDEKQTLLHRVVSLTHFTTIHDGNFRRYSSCYVTIHDGNFRRIYYGYIHALRPGSEEVKQKHFLVQKVSFYRHTSKCIKRRPSVFCFLVKTVCIYDDTILVPLSYICPNYSAQVHEVLSHQ